MPSINIQPIAADDPDLENSRLLDAVYKCMSYAKKNDGIGLTQTKAFNRKFCHWAAQNFKWEEYSEDRLLSIQKVLNEEDVAPVMVLHQLFADMKLGRHIKGKFQFSKKAHILAEDKASFFHDIVDFYLFRFDHSNFQRHPFVAPGNWDVFLNVINVEAHGGVSETDLLKAFYGFAQNERGSREYWSYWSFLHWHVLAPLHWIGFLDKTRLGERYLDREDFYTKSSLWKKCLHLDTDK